MKKTKNILFLFCFIALSQFASSQKLIEGKAIFKQLENRFQVNFNYLPEDAQSFEVPESLLKSSSSLEEIIYFIELHTYSNITEYKDGYYNITSYTYDFCFQFINLINEKEVSDLALIINQNVEAKTNTVGKVFVNNLKQIDHIQLRSSAYELENTPTQFSKSKRCQTVYVIQNETLDEIFIVDYLAKGIRLQNDQGIEINPKEFGSLPGLINPDVFHSLQYVPGVLSPTESISEINTRGGTHDQNLILWNGARMYQTGHFFGMISALNPFSLHEVSVYKNGSSARYGEGVSSVMNINTFSSFEENHQTTMHANLLSGSFSTQQKINNRFQIQASARYSFTDFLNSITYQNFSDRVFQNTAVTENASNEVFIQEQGFFFRDVSFEMQCQPDEKNHFKLGFMAFENQLNFDETSTDEMRTASNLLEQKNALAVASWKHQWNEKQESKINTTASYYNLFAKDASPTSSQILNQENEVLDLGLQLQHKIQLNENGNLLLGYNFQEIGVSNSNIVNQPNIEIVDQKILHIHSAFAETKFYFLNSFEATLGLRTNYYSRINEAVFEPRLNLNYRFNNGHKLFILGQIKHQSLSQVIDQQEDFFGIEKRRWTLNNNNDFQLAKSHQIEVGWNFNQQNWLLQTNLYYKTVMGLNSSSQGFQNQLENVNIIGDYTAFGWEALVQKKWRNWRVWSNFALTQNNYEFSAFTPSVFPNNFELSLSNASGITFENNGYSLSLGSRFHTGKPTTGINENSPILDPDINPSINFLSPNTDNLPVYFQVNASASKQIEFQKSQLQFGLSLMNVFNLNTELNQFYQLNEDATQVENRILQNLAFTPNAFVSFIF
ncbi:TonB-dependent receptor plug domain-containing protein [Psychroflexus planctonicus]|uniref:TonB-dependent receptor plug domain-containing protein n=1 Tax=Psychroflexus planctonicus TaxID=1526575 RepID=A0ABQ1SDF7_9FLAO|nr:TonB-dependent receptor plug domain-containing protein [Psychroflexus planctonicus]GGE30899.1 hypothetical protein GCM10010832_09170 [Psychroflexus planctonicus]